MKTIALILAAGRENHMQSRRAKELHMLMGKTVLETTIDAVSSIVDETVAILGHHAEELRPALPAGCESCVQDFSLGLGTAKAVTAALPLMDDDARVLVTAGDMPCVSTDSYARLISAVDGAHCHAAVLYTDVKRPEGYDRVVFDGDGYVKRIAHSEMLMPHEEEMPSINTSVYCLEAGILKHFLANMQPDAHNVYHISDLIGALAGDGFHVAAVPALDAREGKRIVSRMDLAEALQYIKLRHCEGHMRAGVTIIDPASTYIESDVQLGMDTVIYPGCLLQKGTRVGLRCTLLPNCRLSGTVVGDDATIESSVLINCQIPAGATIGPFACIRGDKQENPA